MQGDVQGSALYACELPNTQKCTRIPRIGMSVRHGGHHRDCLLLVLALAVEAFRAAIEEELVRGRVLLHRSHHPALGVVKVARLKREREPISTKQVCNHHD